MGYLIEDWEQNYANQIWDAKVTGHGRARQGKLYLIVRLTTGPLNGEDAFTKHPGGDVPIGTKVRVRAPIDQFTMGDDRWDLVPTALSY